MKKQTKKLKLAKETMRMLVDTEVEKAWGGTSFYSNCCDANFENEWLSVNPTC